MFFAAHGDQGSPPSRPSFSTMPGRGVLYCSTRGAVQDVSFEDVVLGGLAPDKGLYVPQTIPQISPEQLEQLRDLSFVELCLFVMRQYIGPYDIPPENLRVLIQRSTENFRDQDVTPVRKVGGTYILELYHGPTFAFKDVALQFLGNLFEYFLSRKKGADAKLTILGATSGDTGSAAIHGLRGKKGINVFILFPNGRVSEVQERQMTTVPDKNIHCIRVEGTFDDCQAIVKQAFQDVEFRERVRLGAINSINWARVLAQITYYFYAYFKVTNKDRSIKRVNFSVPTGNFGDILAGYYAKSMGLPIDKLLVATNDNDILHRFFTTGKYWKHGIKATLSPSMDITISSNFERFLFDLAGRKPKKLKEWMEEFEKTDRLTITGELLERAKSVFISQRVDQADCVATIKDFYTNYDYVLCPHSAVGVCAAQKANILNGSTICLATAHHAKFPTATESLALGTEVVPQQLRVLFELPTRVVDLPNSVKSVKTFIDRTLAGKPSSSILLRCVALQDFFLGTTAGRGWLVVATGALGASALYLYQMYYGRRRGRL